MNRRSTWSGHIVFGLTSMPVKLYTMVDDDRERLHQYHDACSTRIAMPRMCPKCDRHLESHEVTLGFDSDNGIKLLTDTDKNFLYPPRPHHLTINSFVNFADIDPIYLDTPYLALPDRGVENAFSALHQALQVSGKAGVGEIALRGTQRPLVLRPVDGSFVVHLMRAPESLRSFDLEPLATTADLLESAHKAVEDMTKKFNLDDFEDDYTLRLNMLKEKKS